jgi:hypothetical protein
MGVLHTYALAPATLRRYLNRSQARLQAVVTLSFVAFGAYLLFDRRPVAPGLVVPVVVVIALVYFVILFFNYRQQLRLLYSVRVDLDGSSIAYRQAGQEPQRVMRGAIARVLEHKDGYLIETSDPRFHLLIPNGLARDGDEVVRMALIEWSGIVSLPKRRSPEPALNLFGFASAVVVLVFANSLWIVIPLGIFIFIWGFYAERRLERSPRILPGTVRMYNSALAFLLFVLLMKSCILTLLLATVGGG